MGSRFLRIFDAEAEQLPRAYWFLFAGTFVNRLGSFVMPMLTIYLTARRGIPLEDAGAILALYGFGSLGGVTVGGVLADRLGRRATMVLGLGLGAAAMLALGAAHEPWQLAVAACAQGMLGDLYRPAAQAIIADLVAPEHRMKAYGLLFWAINLGFAVGTTLAGFLAENHFTALFIGDAATSIVFALIVYRYIPESKPSAPPQGAAGSMLTPFADPTFLPFLILNFLIVLVFMQHVLALPVDMAAKHLGASDFGLAIATNGLLIVLLQPLASRWLRNTPRSWVMAAGSAVTGVGMGAAAFATRLPGFVLSVAIWTLGEIVMSPVSSSIIADLAPAHLRGRYQGAFTLSFSLGMLVAPLAGAWLVRATDIRTLWFACVAVGAICALGQLRLAVPRRRRLAQLGSAISGLRD